MHIQVCLAGSRGLPSGLVLVSESFLPESAPLHCFLASLNRLSLLCGNFSLFHLGAGQQWMRLSHIKTLLL